MLSKTAYFALEVVGYIFFCFAALLLRSRFRLYNLYGIFAAFRLLCLFVLTLLMIFVYTEPSGAVISASCQRFCRSSLSVSSVR